MQSSTPSFLNLSNAEVVLDQLRIRLLQVVLLFLIIASATFSLAITTTGSNIFSGTNIIAPLATLFSFAFLLMVSRNQFVRFISVAVIAYITLVSVFLFAVTEDLSGLFLLMSLSSLAAAFLSSRVVFWVYNAVYAIILIFATFTVSVTPADAITANIGVALLITFSLGLIPLAISTVARYFIVTMETTAIRAQRSASLLAASADIGRNVSEMLELNLLLDRSVEIIRDRFAFYHVSVFLVDDNERYAHLTASTGEIGERMLARGHRLQINAESVVGRTAQSQDVIISRDADDDTKRSYNELLPFTRSELGVPIVDNDGIVGVVDIQSRRPDAFTATEIDALRVIANQLATAIRNARLFEDKERSIRENKRLFIEAETNLREIQRLNRQLTKQAWSDYLRADRRIDGVTLHSDGFQNSAEWSADMITASKRRRAITEEKDGKQRVTVPIELRGEVVGAIELETAPNTKRDDLVDMVRMVSQRLAVSLDNARLFEESNEATAQEQRVSEIVSQYQQVDSVDDLLRVTLQGLAETLGAEQASIRLGAVPDIGELDTDNLLPNSEENGDNNHAV